MTNEQLLKRIEVLEDRVRELEKNPYRYYPPFVPVYPVPPTYPWWLYTTSSGTAASAGAITING